VLKGESHATNLDPSAGGAKVELQCQIEYPRTHRQNIVLRRIVMYGAAVRMDGILTTVSSTHIVDNSFVRSHTSLTAQEDGRNSFECGVTLPVDGQMGDRHVLPVEWTRYRDGEHDVLFPSSRAVFYQSPPSGVHVYDCAIALVEWSHSIAADPYVGLGCAADNAGTGDGQGGAVQAFFKHYSALFDTISPPTLSRLVTVLIKWETRQK